MADKLSGKRVALLVTDGFEQVELTEPKKALEAAGAETAIVAPDGGTVKGWDHTDWGDEFSADLALEDATVDQFDALVLPGGVQNPDKLRVNAKAQSFVRAFFDADKPVAAICHGPWTLINAGVAKGRKLTSYHTLQADLENAGADWVDREVVVDGKLISSRNPDDIPAFSEALIEMLGGGSQD